MTRAQFLELMFFTSINAGSLIIIILHTTSTFFLTSFSVFKKEERILGTLISCVCVKCVIIDSCNFSAEF